MNLVADKSWTDLLLLSLLTEIPRINGSAVVSSDYNEGRFMGAQSVVKYRFVIEIQISKAQSDPIQTLVNLLTEYSPSKRTFKFARKPTSFVIDRAVLALLLCGPSSTDDLQQIWLGLSDIARKSFADRLGIWSVKKNFFSGSAPIASRSGSRRVNLLPLKTATGEHVVLFCNPFSLELYRTLNLKEICIPVLCSTEEFFHFWEATYGSQVTIVERRFDLSESVEAQIYGGNWNQTIAPIELFDVDCPCCELSSDFALGLHILDWMERKSSPNLSLVKVEVMSQLQRINERIVLKWGWQSHHHSESTGAKFYRHQIFECSVPDGVAEAVLLRSLEPGIWSDYRLETSKLLEQWWTLRYISSSSKKMATQQMPGSIAFVEAFRFEKDPPWFNSEPFLNCCLPLLRLAFDVFEDRRVYEGC